MNAALLVGGIVAIGAGYYLYTQNANNQNATFAGGGSTATRDTGSGVGSNFLASPDSGGLGSITFAAPNFPSQQDTSVPTWTTQATLTTQASAPSLDSGKKTMTTQVSGGFSSGPLQNYSRGTPTSYVGGGIPSGPKQNYTPGTPVLASFGTPSGAAPNSSSASGGKKTSTAPKPTPIPINFYGF